VAVAVAETHLVALEAQVVAVLVALFHQAWRQHQERPTLEVAVAVLVTEEESLAQAAPESSSLKCQTLSMVNSPMV